MKWISVIFILLFTPPASAAMKTRIVDVGPGLCAITEIDKSHYFLYDAGHWQGRRCYDALSEMVIGNDIELMVLSHSDSYHLGDAARILNNFSVKSIVRTGMGRSTATWRRTDEAISLEASFGSQVYNLQEYKLKPGRLAFGLSGAQVSILYGREAWTGLSESENRNAISIAARLSYKGHSILFTGDTIGRRLDDEPSACKDAKAEMVALHLDGHIDLDSDVIIAPHHEGNNGSASCSIKAVSKVAL